MAIGCVAYGCTNLASRNKVSFHRIPVNKERRNKWILAINRKNWTPTRHDRQIPQAYTIVPSS